jgi:hypothetical protein
MTKMPVVSLAIQVIGPNAEAETPPNSKGALNPKIDLSLA